MAMGIYKYLILIIDVLLLISGALIFFNVKKYLKLHKDEALEENGEELNEFLNKFKIISFFCIALGVSAFIIAMVKILL